MSVHVSSPIWLVTMPSAAWKCIAVKIADCANDDGESIYPSVARIARETDSDAATVRRALAAFEEAGLVEVVSQTHGNRRYRSTTVRRIDLTKLALLAAVDNRDGSFTPPSHCIKLVDTDETRVIERGKRAGQRVPVQRWAIVVRSAGDVSVYDELAPAGWVHPAARNQTPEQPCEHVAPLAPCEGYPSHSATPPLAPCDPTPRTVRPHPSHSATQTVIELSLNHTHEQRVCVRFEDAFATFKGPKADKVIDRFLRPVVAIIGVRHPQPRELFASIIGHIGDEDEATLEKAVSEITASRSVLAAPRNAIDAVAAAKQATGGRVSTPGSICVIRCEDEAAFDAWVAWAARERRSSDQATRARAALIWKMVDQMGVRQISVPSLWPPGASPPAAAADAGLATTGMEG